jgi:hypothetical protein
MDDQTKPPSWLDLESIIPLKTTRPGQRDVESITNLSEDTVKRRYPDRIKHLSERRLGMKLRHALAIANGE